MSSEFSKTEFLLILVSIVYGFCVVDLFENWGRMLRKGTYYQETLLWSINVFLCIAFLWHNAWDNVSMISEAALNYIMALLPPIFFFLMVSLLFPDRTSEWNLEATFLKNRRRFFLSFAAVIAMVMFVGLLGGTDITLTTGRMFFLGATLVLAFVDKKILRNIVAVCGYAWFGYLLFTSDLN